VSILYEWHKSIHWNSGHESARIGIHVTSPTDENAIHNLRTFHGLIQARTSCLSFAIQPFFQEFHFFVFVKIYIDEHFRMMKCKYLKLRCDRLMVQYIRIISMLNRPTDTWWIIVLEFLVLYGRNKIVYCTGVNFYIRRWHTDGACSHIFKIKWKGEILENLPPSSLACYSLLKMEVIYSSETFRSIRTMRC
jgi:hypothetical protein